MPMYKMSCCAHETDLKSIVLCVMEADDVYCPGCFKLISDDECLFLEYGEPMNESFRLFLARSHLNNRAWIHHQPNIIGHRKFMYLPECSYTGSYYRRKCRLLVNQQGDTFCKFHKK